MYQGKFNKTKIVATIGPATSSVDMLEKIILAGVDVCRLNFSHGTYEQHQENAKRYQQALNERGIH